MSLDYMAQAFGVSTTFIDKELASFITAGRIHAKIDKGKIHIKDLRTAWSAGHSVQHDPQFSNPYLLMKYLVNGIIETNRPDEKNRQYQSVIKKGDLLLNRVQKLSRVINI